MAQNMVYDTMNRMKLTLKKYFIPHEGNDHKPHMLRTEKALIVLSIVLLIEMLFLAQIFIIGKNTNFLAAVISSVIVDKTNTERVSFDLNSLVTDDLLELAAQLKANDMAKKGYFAHETPEGFDPWYWLENVGYNFVAAGENLAVNFTDSEDVVDAWMDSPGHRAKILKDSYTEIGVATAKGEYKGREAIFVVQFFGRPAVVTAETLPIAPESTQTQTLTVGPEKTDVASLQAEKEPLIVEDTFIQTEPIDTTVLAQTKVTPTVENRGTSFIRKVASEPKTTTNYMLVVLATIIAVALLLKVFVHSPVKHPPLIVNGVLLLLIMSSAILVNQYVSTLGATIS